MKIKNLLKRRRRLASWVYFKNKINCLQKNDLPKVIFLSALIIGNGGINFDSDSIN